MIPLSTARRVAGDPVFHQIRDAAEEVISDSPTRLPFQIMLASGGGRWVGDQPQAADTEAGKMALAELAKQRSTLGMANLMSCVQKAILTANQRATSTRPRPAQRIVVVTDGTTPAWPDSDKIALQQLRSTIEQNKLPVQIQVLEIDSSSSQFNNLSVVQLECESDRVGVNESVRLRAEVKNTGDVESASCQMEWGVDDKVIGHSSVDELEPGQSTEIMWSTKFETAGPVAIACTLEPTQPDDLPEDSTAIRIVDVVQRIPILIVNNQSTSTSTDAQSQAIKFLTLGLGYQGEEETEDYHSIFAPTIVSTAECSSEDLSIYSAIIVVGTNNDSSGLSDLLLPEVQRGCGVWVVISSDPDVDAFNEDWFQDGVGLSPLELVNASKENLPSDTKLETEEIRIHPPSAQHPAMRVMSDQQRIDLDQVTFQSHAIFQSLSLGDEVSIPLRSNRGEPLVVENAIGKGRVFFQSFPISLQTTNWPVTNSFVVIVHEWLEYLTQPSAPKLNLSAGSPLVWHYKDRNVRPASLRLPDSTNIDLTEDAALYGVDQSAGTFRYFSTRSPGEYRAKTSAMSEVSIEMPFYVQPPSQELLAEPLSKENRDLLKDVGHFVLANSSRELQASAQAFWSQQTDPSTTKGGQPLWQWFVLALFALLILELWLAGRVGKRRGGVSDSAAEQLVSMEKGAIKNNRKKSLQTS